MSFLNWLTKRNLATLILLGALPFLFSAVWNHGFIASDEYWTGITRYIPAQSSSLKTLVAEDDVKSPVQLLPMHLLAQTALGIGIRHPFAQYEFVVFGLGLLATFLLFGAFAKFPFDDVEKRLGFLMLGFYCLAPSLMTRPMFEPVSAPFLAWAAVFAVRYDRDARWQDLVWGATWGALAFCFRPQTGICCLIFPILAIVRRQWKDLGIIALWGAVLFLVSGLPDLWLRGSWHRSLNDLIRYNVANGGDYGHEPWFYYLPLLFLASFGPWMIARYGREWRVNYYRRFRSLIWMIAIFVFEHSLFTHKFERFIFPLIPVFILLMVPPVLFFVRDAGHRRWRLGSLLFVNFAIFLPATFTEPQGHLIEIVRYFETRPEVTTVVSFDEALTWLPDAFREKGQVGVQDHPWTDLKPGAFSCASPIMVRSPFVSRVTEALPQFHVVREFRPGMGDRVAFALNPSHNVRRSPLVLLECGAARK